MSDLPAVPDYYGQFMAPLQRQQALNIDQQNANAQEAQVRLLAMQQAAKARQAQQFQVDAQSVIANPTADGYRTLLLKHPEQYEGIKAAWEQQSEGQRTRDTQAASQVYAALANGRSDLALSLLKDRKTAMTNGGEDDKITDQLIEMVSSGDPAKVKQAQGIAGFVLANSAGPDKIGSMLEALGNKKGGFTLDAGAVRFDDDGNVIAQSPYLKDAAGTIYERDSSGAPSTATPNPAAPEGFEHAVSTVLANEGGFAPKDMNGKPVNFGINQGANPDLKVKDLTREQAIQIYHDRYWVPSGAESLPANMQTPYFDVYIRNPKFAKVALAKSGGDPAKFMDLADNYFGGLAKNNPSAKRYAQAWANRDAGNRAIATGSDPSGAASGAGAPSGYHVLLPAGPGSPPSGYEADPTKPGALRPIVGGPADQEGGLDPGTVTLYAQQILTGGQMPPLGMGKSATASRQAIMNEVAKLAGADGMTGKDLAVQIGHYKANLANVQNLEKQAGTIEGNEQTAIMNGQQFIDRSAELSGQTRFPVVNSVTQSYLRHTGDPTVAAMDSAWNTFTAEYAKVVAGSPSGAGVLSDSARHEAMDTMRGNYSVAQKKAAFVQMKADMANRLTAIHNQIAKGYDSLGARAQGTKASGKTVVRTGKDKSGRKVVQYSDGTVDYAN